MTHALLLWEISLAWLHHLLLIEEIVVFGRVLHEWVCRAIVLSERILIVFSEVGGCVPHVLTVVNIDNLPFKSYVIACVDSANCTTQTIQVVGRTLVTSTPLHSLLRWLNTVWDTNEFFLIATVVAFAELRLNAGLSYMLEHLVGQRGQLKTVPAWVRIASPIVVGFTNHAWKLRWCELLLLVRRYDYFNKECQNWVWSFLLSVSSD